MKKIVSLILVLAVAASVCVTGGVDAVSAAKMKLNKTKITLKPGQTFKLVVKNKNKAVKWSSSKKKVATVNKKGKVKAKKIGTAKIYAKVGNKKLVCKVKVKGGKVTPEVTPSPSNTVAPNVTTNAPEVTNAPVVTEVPAVTEVPDVTAEPGSTDAPEVTNAPDEPDKTAEPQKTSAPTKEPTNAPAATTNPDSLASAPTDDPNTKDDGWVEGWY